MCGPVTPFPLEPPFFLTKTTINAVTVKVQLDYHIGYFSAQAACSRNQTLDRRLISTQVYTTVVPSRRLICSFVLCSAMLTAVVIVVGNSRFLRSASGAVC